MRGLGRAYGLGARRNDSPRTVAAVLLTGPRGGYIGDVCLGRVATERLRDQLDTLLAEDTARRLAAQHVKLGVKP